MLIKNSVLAAFRLVFLASALWFVFLASAARADNYLILIDGSASNLMVTDKAHAFRMGQDTVREIGELKMRDRLTVSTIGDFAGNQIIEAQVDASFPPEVAMDQLAAMIAGMPDTIADIGGPAQVTHIQGALQLHGSRLDCSVPTKVIVLTDGMETGDKLRPVPAFSGCSSMVMIGVIADTPAHTEEITTAWTDWCQRSGFSSCSVRY